MTKTTISTPHAPVPVAAYAQATRKCNLLQVAGQVAIDPSTNEITGTTVLEQALQVFRNLDAVLEAADSGPDDLIMVRAYLTDTAHFRDFSDAYDTWIREPFPARTTVYVGLPPGLLVEVDALAVLD